MDKIHSNLGKTFAKAIEQMRKPIEAKRGYLKLHREPARRFIQVKKKSSRRKSPERLNHRDHGRKNHHCHNNRQFYYFSAESY